MRNLIIYFFNVWRLNIQAWKLEFEASAPMGFKYAYCLLKNKQMVDAIDIWDNSDTQSESSHRYQQQRALAYFLEVTTKI